MKSFLLAMCFIFACLVCSDVSAQCSGGSCSLANRAVVARSVQRVRTVAVRPFRRGWFSRVANRR